MLKKSKMLFLVTNQLVIIDQYIGQYHLSIGVVKNWKIWFKEVANLLAYVLYNGKSIDTCWKLKFDTF
jgi:hypothetical protein